MTPWQLLRAGRASRAAPGSRVGPGPGVPVRAYRTVPAAPGRSFCRQKVTMASYLQQAQCLEAANQRLELRIQEQLDRRCPVDGHARTVSLLQDQIAEGLRSQAQAKLQLLSAELSVHALTARWEKEREQLAHLEAGLSDLRRAEEELRFQELPELQSLLKDQNGRVTELQTRHGQDMRALLGQVSGAVSVERRSALIQQLEELRRSSRSRCLSQVPVRSPRPVTFDPPKAAKAELVQLRRAAARLERELTQLQSQNRLLCEGGVDQGPVLQLRADALRSEVDSVLKDLQVQLEINTTLETHIRHYERMRVSSHLLNSSPDFSPYDSSFGVQGGPPAVLQTRTPNLSFRRNTSTTRGSVHAGQIKPCLDGRAVNEASKESNAATTGFDKIPQSEESEIKQSLNIKLMLNKATDTVTPAEGQLQAKVMTSETPPLTILGPEGAQGLISTRGDLTEEVGEDARLPLRFKQKSTLNNWSNSEQKQIRDVDVAPSSRSQVSSPESEGACPEIKEEIELVIITQTSVHYGTSEVHGAPGESSKLAAKESSQSSSESRKSPSPTDSGPARNSSDPEELLSPGATDVFLGREELMTRTNPSSFYPIDLEEHTKSPDSLPSVNEPETCLMESKDSVSEEHDEESCLGLTEAHDHVRPVEKYILSTTGREHSPSEEDGVLSVKGGAGSKGTNICQLSQFSGPRGLREEQLGFGGLHQEEDVRGPGSQSRSGGILESPSVSSAAAGPEGRFRRGQWMVYGGRSGDTRFSAPSAGCEVSLPLAKEPVTNQSETGRFASRGGGEWMVYGGSLRRRGSVEAGTSVGSEGNTETQTRPQETERFSRSVDPGSLGCKNRSWSSSGRDEVLIAPTGVGRFGSAGSGEWKVYGGRSYSSPSTDSQSVATKPATSPTPAQVERRFGSAGSGEWRVYGQTAARLSSANEGQETSGPRFTSAGGGARMSSGGVVRRSRSVGRAGSTGSDERKRRSSVRSAGWPGGGKTAQRAQSPNVSCTGGRVNGAGGRVLSSNRPIRNTGSGAGGSKERISVCKMAALSISAAGKGRSQERRDPRIQQQQQTAVTAPLVQRWLTTGVGATSADPGGLDVHL